MEKNNDRNLKCILRTHGIRTITLPTPKFRPTPILWTHATRAKISTFATHTIFWPTPKLYRLTPPTPPTPKFDPRHPQINVPTLFTPTTHPRYPHHLCYLADSNKNICAMNLPNAKALVGIKWPITEFIFMVFLRNSKFQRNIMGKKIKHQEWFFLHSSIVMVVLSFRFVILIPFIMIMSFFISSKKLFIPILLQSNIKFSVHSLLLTLELRCAFKFTFEYCSINFKYEYLTEFSHPI